MLFEILFFVFLGVAFGTITGLIPGIHVNLISLILLSLSGTIFLKLNTIYFLVFLASMATTHTFLDFIPSIFLGAPDTDTELSTLPGHNLLKEGRGYEAVMLTIYGSISAIFVLILLTFPAIELIKQFYSSIRLLIPYILIFASIFLIYLEKNKVSSILIFSLAGILGLSVLNLGINEPILPLLMGLFGGSIILQSIINKTEIPKQIISQPRIKIFRPLLGATLSAPICSFLPGFGSGQAAVLGSLVTDRRGENNKENFLFLVGAINTLVMGFSFITLYAISKARTGVAAAMKTLIQKPSLNILILLLLVVVLSGIISFFWAIKLTKFFSKNLTKINYTYISYSILFILLFIIFLISGIIGIFIFLISTLLGLYTTSLNVRRINLMSCLIVPTIVLFLKI